MILRERGESGMISISRERVAYVLNCLCENVKNLQFPSRVPSMVVDDTLCKATLRGFEDAHAAVEKGCYVRAAIALDEASRYLWAEGNPATVALIEKIRAWLVYRAFIKG